MIKNIKVVFLLVFFSGSVFATCYKHTTILMGILSIDLPNEFNVLTPESKKIKYPGQNAPQEVYSNEDVSVSFGFSNTHQSLKKEELGLYVSNVLKSLKDNGAVSENTQSEIKKSNGIEMYCISFESQAIDSRVYNRIYFMVIKNNLIMANFNCLSNQRNRWIPICDSVFNTLKM